MSSDAQYAALPSVDIEHNEYVLDPARPKRSRIRATWLIIGVQNLVIIILAILLYIRGNESNSDFAQLPYSPAQHVLEPQLKTFTMEPNSTVYQGEPSKAVDDAWSKLYNNIGISKIPKSEARLLPNKTLPIPGDEENYVAALSVFHQLHCLNILRKALRPDYYRNSVTGYLAGISPEMLPDHLSHCVDNIRQSLMCSSDISVIVWQWDDAAQVASPRMDTVHSCRNFDKVVEWAKDHRNAHFDVNVHVKDDLVTP
ncbi:hypothetical protein QCA50_000887 [Cerrena zonata]|uniref:Cyclochlorotine biosynthesis protein O n=1 Tax=Cerrena zonata TaxID=2478898 RepID=A0AAW0H0J8_9APHY